MNKNQTESWLCYCRMYLHRLAVTVSPHLFHPYQKCALNFPAEFSNLIYEATMQPQIPLPHTTLTAGHFSKV
jgi:hypothetical protein